MAIVSDVEIRLRADIARLQQDMNAARRSVSVATTAMKNALGGVVAGFSLVKIVTEVVNAQREFDKLNSSLYTATGSAGAAAGAFKALQAFAASTPYSVAEATEAFIKLRNLGLTPSERALGSYGNTAAAMGKGLNQMIEAVADAATGEFERLKEFGVKAKQNGDQVLFTFQGVTKSIGNNAKDIEAYLMRIGEVEFAGAMERRANTLDGAISNLGDTWSSVMRSISSNGFGEGVMAGVLALSGALTDLAAIINTVGGAAKKEGEAVKEASVLHQALTTVFETVAVLGVNVAYVFTQVGKELGGLAAQAAAVAHGDLAGAKAIGVAMRAEAAADREAVDAKSAAILGAAAKAQAAREKEAADIKKNGTDRLAGYAKELSAEEKRNQAALAIIDIQNKLNGVDKDTAGNLAKLKTALDTGAISYTEYARLVALTKKNATEASTAYKDQVKALDMSAEAIKRRAAAQAFANQQDAEHLAFLNRTGQLNDQDFAAQKGASELKTLEENKAALEAQLVLEKKRIDNKAKLADLNGQIAAADAAIDAKKLRNGEALFELEQKSYREAIGHTADLIEAAQAETKAQQDKTRDQRDELEALGLTSEAVAQLTAARLRDQAVALDRRAELAMIEEVANAYRAQAEEMRKQADIAINREQVQKAQAFWGDVEKTAHDTFLSIQDGGASMWKRLRDSGKNMFFEWLYQMTLKKWVINVGASFDGSAATAGISNLVGGGSGAAGSGILGTVGNLYSAVSGGMTLAGGLGSGFMGSLAGGLNGAGIGSGLTSSVGLSIGNSIAGVVGPSVAGAISSGLGALAAAAPWVAGAVAVFALANKAFGHGPKEYSGNSTLSGTIGGSGTLDAKMLADWTEKGGWFSSDRHGVDKLDVGQDLAAGLVATYQTIKDSTAQYAKVLGINADAITNRAQTLSIALGKDDAANQKAITEFFSGVADTVAREVLPDLAQFQQSGETAAQTLQRVATNFQGIEVILAAMGTDSQTMFGAVGVASIAARERLVQLSGGLDSLVSQTEFYYQNFLTKGEQVAITQKPLQDALTSLGYAGITTTDQFKAAAEGLLQSGALATEEGAKKYAGLMALAPQFKTVADYLKEVSDTAAQTAQELADAAKDLADARSSLEIELMQMQGNTAGALAAQRRVELASMDESLRPLKERIYALQDEQAALDRLNAARAENSNVLSGLADGALSALGRAVEAEKARVDTALRATFATLDASIASVNDTITRTGDLSKALKGAITAPGTDNAARVDVGRAEISAALAIAKASGILPTADSLALAMAAVAQDSAGSFTSAVDYQRAVARTNSELEQLGGLTDGQLNTAQLQLQALEAQKAQAQAAHDAELATLDGILTNARAELDAINGVATGVLSGVDAVRAVQVALGALRDAPTSAGGAAPAGIATVEDLYRRVLGREGEAAGVAYWKRIFGDAVDQSEYFQFVQGAQSELKGMMTAPPTVATSSGAMSESSAMVAQLQTLNTRIANMEVAMNTTAKATDQFAQQFHQVSGGGNALATEVI